MGKKTDFLLFVCKYVMTALVRRAWRLNQNEFDVPDLKNKSWSVEEREIGGDKCQKSLIFRVPFCFFRKKEKQFFLSGILKNKSRCEVWK